MKSFRGSISLNSFQPPLIIHFTICWVFFIVTWAEESFRQHSVGGCPFVSMHSICVGCLLASALLWMRHWKAQAPWLQSDRCRLVGASLLTACRQTHKQRLQCTNSQCEIKARLMRIFCACAPESISLASDLLSICLHHESDVVNEETILCRMRNVSSICIYIYYYHRCFVVCLFHHLHVEE